MGAWGHGIFENDASLDWVTTFEAEGAEAVSAAVTAAMRPGYLDADVASEALAACAVVAAAAGGGLPEDAPETLRSKLAPVPDLAAACQRIVLRAKGPQSELAELWAEAGPEGFEAALADLKARLPDVAPAELPDAIGKPGPALGYGLDLPVTPQALTDWVLASFAILETRAEVDLGPPPQPDDIVAFMTAAAARARELDAALGLPPYADGEAIPTEDSSPGGLRFFEVCLSGHFRRVEALLNGGEDD